MVKPLDSLGALSLSKRLYRMARTAIERHIKVKGEANPYDPQYADYFEKRKSFAWRVYRTSSAGKPAETSV